METTTLTPALRRLVSDAEAAGYTISERGVGFTIWKGRPGKPPTAGVHVLLSPEGPTNAPRCSFWYAYRVDVRLDLANKITTIKTVRKVLGL